MAVEGLVGTLDRFPSTAHLFYLDRHMRLFTRAHLVDQRPVHLWLADYLDAYPEDTERAWHLVVAKAGRNGSRDLFLVSSRRPHEVWTLHVTPRGRLVWNEAKEGRITQVLRAHMS